MWHPGKIDFIGSDAKNTDHIVKISTFYHRDK
ncbi:hypothetical protein IAD21_05213 [Abditibacteriota bacterium]|nr:hypothetical protein IAD21_05213 [Abditibacteriota bacterium]